MLEPVASARAPTGRSRLVVILLGALFTVWALVFIYRTSFIAIDGRRYFSLFDDAMISMRYAWNASHGLGLVWNPGERVEGYTNLLMVGLMSVWTSFLDKSSAVLAVQLSGIPILLGIAVLTRLHWLELLRGGDVHYGESFGILAFLGALGYYPLVYWTLTGMETGLLTLLLLAASLCSLVYMRAGRSSTLAAAALAFSLAYLARPDSAPIAVLVLVFASLLGTGGPRKRFAALGWSLTLYAVFPVLQTVFRALYYGSLVPLTYTLKATGMPWAIRLQNGVGFTLPFLQETRWAFLLAGTGAVSGLSKRKVLLAVPPLVITAYQIAIGGDAWPYWRLVAPAMPFLILLALTSIDWIATRLGPAARAFFAQLGTRVAGGSPTLGGLILRPSLARVIVMLTAIAIILTGTFADYLRPGSPGLGTTQLLLVLFGTFLALAAASPHLAFSTPPVALCAILVLFITTNSRFLQEACFLELPYKAEANRNHVNVALTIVQYTTEDASVGVFRAGIIPYYTSRYAVDFLGKNDPYIANLPINLEGGPSWYGMSSVPGHNKYDLEYSIRQRLPTYVEEFVWGSQDLTDVFRSQYVEVSLPGPDPAFRRGDPAVRWDLIPSDKILYP